MRVETVAQNQNKAGNSSVLGIYAETDPLRRVALWGPVGAEAVLAQFYPLQTSLFHSNMNVPIARQEADRFADLLLRHGVESFSVRDQLATSIQTGSQTDLSEVRDLVHLRAATIHKEHKVVSQGRYADLMDHLGTVLDEDTQRYGEERALALNKTLCLDVPMPLGNLIYARDQMNVVLDTRVSARMRKRIRTHEVPLFDKVYEEALGIHKSITVPEWNRLEGGDVYLHGNIVYVGVGPRTTAGAAHFLFTSLEGDLQKHGFQMAIVEDEDFYERPPDQQMDFMHLDTFSNPVGKQQVAVCEEAAAQRRVKFFERRNGKIVLNDTGHNFIDHLAKQGNEIITIPREEQQMFGCNFLAIDDKVIIVPLDSNSYTNDTLRTKGKEIVYADLVESTKGYGAAHCMTGQLYRESNNNGR